MIICGPFGHHPYIDQRKSEEADTNPAQERRNIMGMVLGD
jgi:hypothetical protein